MRKHLAARFAFFILGIVLLYAPIALLTRGLLLVTDSPLCADCHRICLRMPISWMVQPWMYKTMWANPTYLVVIMALPLIAFFISPLFCGWLCPAGLFTEFISKIVPDKFKIDLAGKVNPAPVRYGVLVGVLIAPFVGGNVACAFCNFAMMQNLVHAAFGNFTWLMHWSSFTLATFIIWLVVLGLFVKGGRGWCNFLCPAGALMGLAHALGSKLPSGYALRIDNNRCGNCQTCISACPAWAISKQSPQPINHHLCNGCMDCMHVCPNDAIDYSRPRKTN